MTLGIIAQIYQPCFAATYDSGSNRIVLSLTQTTGTTSGSEDNRRLVVCDIIISGSTGHSVSRDNYNLVNENMVLTFGNTKEYTPTTVYSPATKKYVDDSIKESLYYVNNDKFLSYFITPAYRIDSDAEDSIIMCFNTIDNFKAFVDKAIDAGVTLVFINNNFNEKIYIRDYHVYRSNNNNRELSFIFNYSNNGESFQFITTRVFISYNASHGYKFVVKNLISSDNLTTITKKTAAEYEAIGSKDANTVYCVTD